MSSINKLYNLRIQSKYKIFFTYLKVEMRSNKAKMGNKKEIVNSVNKSDKYIQEVITRFNDLSSRSDRTSLSSSEDKTISDLLVHRQNLEASEIALEHITNKRIPCFITLRQLSGWGAGKGYSAKVKIFQDTAKTFYPKLIKAECGFEHHFCEATFREGNHKEALSHLGHLINMHTHKRQVTETASFIMRLLPGASEENHIKAMEIVKGYIESAKEYKPAVYFWKTCIMSEQFSIQNLSHQLLEEVPDLLEGEQKRVVDMVECAFHSSDVHQLHLLIRTFLKADCKELLSKALSSLLNLYCTMGNLRSAQEIFDFAREKDAALSPQAARLFAALRPQKKGEEAASRFSFLRPWI